MTVWKLNYKIKLRTTGIQATTGHLEFLYLFA